MKEIEKMKCNENCCIDDLLKCINGNATHTAFVVDDRDVMVGLVTDGDVRRIMLEGYSIKDKAYNHINRDFIYAHVDDEPEKIAGLFNKKVFIVPILDHEGHIVDYSEYNEQLHISVAQPLLNGNEYRYLMEAFLSTWISSSGKYITKFEDAFSKYCGVKYGVATSNGTTALHLALAALDIKAGDEVIVPDLTFAATINSVLYTGATPVIVDIEEDSWCIDPRKIEEAITPRTKAIIPVHLYGQPCDMGRICSIAKKYNLFIIEDCAEAHGAMWNGKKVGTFGQIGCFSFFGNKVITTGEGGMCITNDEALFHKMKVLRDHGMSKDRRYYHEVIGFNYRMTNMQAAVGCAQLERIDKILSERKSLENKYRLLLKNSALKFQKNNFPQREKITWLVSALIDENIKDTFIESLKKAGIDTRGFFFPLSDMEIYKEYAKDCVVSHKISKQGINFPTSYKVDADVITKISEILNGLTGAQV